METIKYDFSNLMAESIGEAGGIRLSDIDSVKERGLRAHLKLSEARSRGEVGFFNLPDDKKNTASILEAAKRISSKYENILVLGIGGSALGMKFLAGSLLPAHYNLLPTRLRRGCPKIFICDNIDPDNFEPLLDMLDWKQTCVNVISKSGRTTETMAQFLLVKEILKKKHGAERWSEHVIVTTDPDSGPLRRIANEEKMQSFSVPVNVGGRFSVFSSVGLFPAACTGIDISKLLEGAGAMRDQCSEFDVERNPAYRNAIVHCLFDELKKMPTSVMMPYSERLNLFSDWYAQLLGESLGKEGKGITPVKAVGVTDQHSQIQLYMDGPRDKVVTFVGVEKFERNTALPAGIAEPFEYVSRHSLASILKAEENATAGSLKEAGRPHLRISLSEVNEYNVGALIMAYQIQIAYMGMLMQINPFNQPGVELGKKLTKEILSR